MKMTVIYGTANEMAALTTPLINEVVMELCLVAAPVLVVLPTLDAVQIEGLQRAMDESETDYAVVFVSDMNLSTSTMAELTMKFPFIESFRHAHSPFHKAYFMTWSLSKRIDDFEQAEGSRVVH